MAGPADDRSLERNVGAMTLLALGFFAWMILFVGDMNPFGGEYFLYADFDEVQLLQNGDVIRKNGLVIGKVEGFRFEKGRVRVGFRIKRAYAIRRDADVAVGNVGLFGANYIKVSEPVLAKGRKDPGNFAPGDVIEGNTAPDFESLLAGGNDLLDELRTTVRAVHTILGDEDFKANILGATRELKDGTAAGRRSLEKIETSLEKILGDAEDATASVRRFMGEEGGFEAAMDKLNSLLEQVEGIAKDNRHHLRNTTEAVRDIVVDLRDQAVAEKIAGAASEMEKLLSELGDFVEVLNEDGETPEKLRRITDRLEKITTDVASMTGVTREAVEESDLKGNLSRAFDDVHTIASRVDEIGGALGKFKAEVVASLFYSDGKDDFRPDLNLKVGFGEEFFARVGIEDIGDRDDFNLQVGRTFGDVNQIRVGIVADEFGIGYDRYLFRKAIQLRLEAYRPDDLLFRYAARIQVRKDTFVTFRRQDEAVGRDRVSYVGVETRF